MATRGSCERCEGLPFGPCPGNRCDTTVKFGSYDLFLCTSCESTRDAERQQQSGAKVSLKKTKKNVKQSEESMVTAQDQGSVATTLSSKSLSQVSAAHVTNKTSSQSALASSKSQPSTSDAAAAEPSCLQVEPRTVLNHLLTYASFYRNRATESNLVKVLTGFYSPAEISESKKCLVSEFTTEVADCQLKGERRSSSVRAAHHAEAEDIIGLLSHIDNGGSLINVKFVASELDRLPCYGPEELNVCVVVDRQVHMEAVVEDLIKKVDILSNNNVVATDKVIDASFQQTQACMQSLCQQFSRFQGEVTARMDQLNSVCVKLNEAATVSSSKAPNTSITDRSLNVLLFGIEEDKNASGWHQKVLDILKYVAGNDVDTVDMFRLGRFDTNKVRPVMVKLRSVWDKRILLSNSYKLKQYIGRVFLVADEPIDVQRKNTMLRMKTRAERDGKQVTVHNGVLVVNNIAIFSLEKGVIRSSQPILNNGDN